MAALTHFGIESLVKDGPFVLGLSWTALIPGAFHVAVSALGQRSELSSPKAYLLVPSDLPPATGCSAYWQVPCLSEPPFARQPFAVLVHVRMIRGHLKPASGDVVPRTVTPNVQLASS